MKSSGGAAPACSSSVLSPPSLQSAWSTFSAAMERFVGLSPSDAAQDRSSASGSARCFRRPRRRARSRFAADDWDGDDSELSGSLEPPSASVVAGGLRARQAASRRSPTSRSGGVLLLSSSSSTGALGRSSSPMSPQKSICACDAA